ncbi:amino acid transporter [Shinella oryzae]|nr:amino acid transporter [Shinella oryzae]
MSEASPIPHDAWCAWHPQELARRVSCVRRPWCVVGGWALDLWHGAETRPHEDIEFTVLRAQLPLFRHALTGLRFHAVGNGEVRPLLGDEAPPADIAQVWCEDVAAGCWRADMMLEEGTLETWIYKRDPSIRRSRTDMVQVTKDGIPYLAPEAVLLFKAKYRREKDEADFARAAPMLDEDRRRWLKACIAKAYPDHGWLAAL